MSFVGLVARRMVVHRRAKSLRGVVLGCALIVALGSVALALGERGPGVLACMWLACLIGSVAVLIDRLRPMLVVAVVGLALGVASLFVVLGVASGIERTLVGSLARLNGHAMVNKYGLDFEEYEDIADALVRDERVRAAAPFVFGVGAIVVVEDDAEDESGDLSGDLGPVIVTIKGVDPQRLAAFSGAAELFAAGDLSALRPAGPRTPPGIVLGTRLARRIGARVGDRVRVVVPESIRQGEDPTTATPRHGEFELLGLLDTGFAEFDASFVLMHLTAAQAIVFGQRRVSGVELELREPRLARLGPVAAELVAGLNAPRTQAGLPPLYRAASWAERSPELAMIRQTKALIVLVLSAIILVSSGSLLGALLLLVRREHRHIGVLAALGARPRQLFWVFELVGVGIGVAGSGLGLIWGGLSLAALRLVRLSLDAEVYMIDHLPVDFVLADLVIPTGIAVGVCALVSGPVARKVGRTRPLSLLR